MQLIDGVTLSDVIAALRGETGHFFGRSRIDNFQATFTTSQAVSGCCKLPKLRTCNTVRLITPLVLPNGVTQTRLYP